MNIHFIGIGGIGISGLAQLCKSRGDSVSGSNLGETLVFPILKKAGITNIYDTHEESHVPQNTDLVIYTEAIFKEDMTTDNPEYLYAKKQNIPIKSYFEYLGEISKQYRTIAVAGTHGKTTTTGLIACGFMECDFDCTILVGSTLNEFDGNNFKIINPETFCASPNSRPWLLVEACEYRENFKFLEPEILIFTNIEHDHADFFKTEKQYFQAFENLGRKAKIILCHQDDDVSRDIAEKAGTKVFPIPAQSPNSVECLLNIFGEVNAQNATLALGLAAFLNLKIESFKRGLGKFKGAGRRQEFLGKTKKGVLLYDDYGHHPTEIEETIKAFRLKFPNKKIGIIYEPHQYSRTKIFFEGFTQSLTLADFTGIFPIYEARDTDEDKASVSINDLIKKIPNSTKVETQKDAELFLKNLSSGDILLFMGAGVISDFAHKFVYRNK